MLKDGILEKLDEAVAGAISAKDKSLLGIGVLPGFHDDFSTIANDAAPDTASWSVVENGGGSVTVENDLAGKPGRLKCISGGTTGDDGIAHTADKRMFSLKNSVTTLHLSARLKFDITEAGVNTPGGIGFFHNEAPVSVLDLTENTKHVATIIVDGNTPRAYSTDGADAEVTDVSAHISDNTLFDLEIVISASDVKFYIDGTLRATHETRVPSNVWCIVVAAQSVNTAQEYTYVENIKVWGE